MSKGQTDFEKPAEILLTPREGQAKEAMCLWQPARFWSTRPQDTLVMNSKICTLKMACS